MSFKKVSTPITYFLFLIPLFILILTGLFLFFRGPYISRALENLILPELSNATGRQITADRIYINIFPLFIEARGIKVFDSGTAIVKIPKVKGYIGIMAFLKKEINIRRLVINTPELRSDLSVLEDMIGKVNEYLSLQRKLPFKVTVKGINLNNGRFELTSGKERMAYGPLRISLNGVTSDLLIGPALIQDGRVNLSVHDAELSLKDWPSLKGSLRSTLFIRKDSIDLKTFELMINGSEIATSGFLPLDQNGFEIKTRFRLLMETLKGLFGLKNRGEGELRAEGSLRSLKGLKGIRTDFLNSLFIDLDLKGSIYIQSLLELVKVKEKIEGLVDFSGNLKGQLKNLTGKGKAIMRNGNLFGISVKTLRCDINYRDGMLHLFDGKASFYNGTAHAMASIQLYGGNFYSVEVKADEVDSVPLLDLIGWRPDIPRGKVMGEFRTAGSEFRPSGWFAYRPVAGASGTESILKKVRSIKGFYTMEKDVLTLYDVRAETGASELMVNGDLDIPSSIMDLETRLLSQNIAEISSPFLEDLSGSARFYGTVKGGFNDPIISGHIEGQAISFKGHRFGQVNGDIVYRKDKLIIKEVVSRDGDSEIKMKGSIGFSEAKDLFDLKNPLYDLHTTIKNLDLKDDKLLKSLIRETINRQKTENRILTGRIDADLFINGKAPELRGAMKIIKPSFYEITFDSAMASFIYKEGDIRFKDIILKKSSEGMDSIIQGEGVIHRDETVRFILSGKISIEDIYKKGESITGRLGFMTEGKGRLKNPDIDITANLAGARYKKTNIGNGRIKAILRDKELTFESLLFNDKAIIKGNLNFEDISWRARVELKPGRYDSLVTTFLKDIPEDLLLNIKGHIDLSGKGKHFTGEGLIDEMNLTLYGHSFSSERDIRFSMKNWRLTVPHLKMRSGATSFEVHGVVDPKKDLDVSIEGRSSLLPIKGFSRKIETIRGESEFVLSISGGWDSPKINGGLSVSNAFLGIKGIPHRLSNAKGYLYIDEDRIVIDKLTGKIGGGDIEISGITYLNGFKVNRFYIDSVVNDITMHLSKDFPINFNGNLLLRGTKESRTLSGEIRINWAKYKERVEWKSWLLKAKAKERPRAEIGAIGDTTLNIKVYGSENITIDNNIARAHAKLDMLLRGTIIQPVILGRVESTRGNIYFRNNEFSIVKASADFSDPRRINPVMEIVAEASVKGYNIRLNLEGQMEHFNLSLISDPSLPEIDILSLLTVGRFGKELKGLEGGIGAGEATSFLTGKLQDVIEERVRSLTGLDRLEVDPYVSKTTGTISPRITVSKRLIGDRLFVTYSSTVGTAENNILKLEYILNKNISLIGVRDEKGGMGGDIKFRFEFK